MARGSSSNDTSRPESPAGRAPALGARPGKARRVTPVAAPQSVPWPAFTRALADALAVLENRQYLLLTRTAASSHVQVAAERDGRLRLEATSNHYLEGERRLTRAQIRVLRRLGWLPPTHGPRKTNLTRRERLGSPNYYLVLTGEVDHLAAARLLVATNREVYGVPLPGALTYTAFDEDGRDILLPTLGIGRETVSPERSGPPAPLHPKSSGELEGMVVEALKGWTDKDDWAFDGDGDLQLSRGGVDALLRVARKLPFVDVFSTVLHGVEPSLELFAALNERNNDGRCVMLTLMGSRVVACVSVDASTFVPDLLSRALSAIAETAEAARAELRPRFGGRATLEDEPAPRPTSTEPSIN